MCIYIKGMGPDRQPEGERLEHEDLRAALEHRGAAAGGKQTVTTVTFSVEEWAVFGVPEGLTLHHYVIAGQAVFRPKPPTPELNGAAAGVGAGGAGERDVVVKEAMGRRRKDGKPGLDISLDACSLGPQVHA